MSDRVARHKSDNCILNVIAIELSSIRVSHRKSLSISPYYFCFLGDLFTVREGEREVCVGLPTPPTVHTLSLSPSLCVCLSTPPSPSSSMQTCVIPDSSGRTRDHGSGALRAVVAGDTRPVVRV